MAFKLVLIAVAALIFVVPWVNRKNAAQESCHLEVVWEAQQKYPHMALADRVAIEQQSNELYCNWWSPEKHY